MGYQGTFSILLHEMVRVFDPLAKVAGSPDAFSRLMWSLGYYAFDMPPPIARLATQASSLVELLSDIPEGEPPNAEQCTELSLAISRVVQAILQIAVDSSEFSPELIANGFLEEFPCQLIDYLLADYLYLCHPTIYGILTTFGLLEVTEIEETETRPDYVKYRILWGDFGVLLNDPKQVLSRAYGWGEATFNPFLVYRHVLFLLGALGVRAYLSAFDTRLTSALEGNTEIPSDTYRMSVKVPLFEEGDSGEGGEIGFGLYGLPMTRNEYGEILQPGLVITPYASGHVEECVSIDEHFSLLVESKFDLSAGLGMVIRPDRPLDFFADIFPSSEVGETPPSGGQLMITLKYFNEAAQPTTLVGSADASRMEIKSVSARGGVRLLSTEETDFLLELILQGGKIVIDATEGDGFLSRIFPEEGISAAFDLVLGMSHARGFYFEGSGGLETDLPTHVSLGPVEIEHIRIAVNPGSGGIPLTAGASIKTVLGPLTVVIENVGLSSNLSFPENGGNLGPLDLVFGFKPPNGVGLTIDAEVVRGGGYLYFDFDKEEYAGVLELDLSGIVSVKAIGLITTRMPDGSAGFSLLIIITAEFGSPIQLGFGFTLSGVGGLLGLNRTMRLEVIATGIRDGGINSLMFPQNVVENAPRIISDLKTYFPVEEGTFLIGPMVKIGWGTPNLITVSLGILIEIPGNIAILGVLKVALPDDEAAVIVIQVNFMGAIEFDKKRLWFLAALFESRVLFITLEGEMGLLVGWGDDASFVVSVGGFHPAFNPPPLPFGAIARIAISILNEDYARIRIEGYFAVTSNSVQFGAAVELFFGVSAFRIEGHLAFDALFRFSPFYFIISISTSLSVKVFGIGLFSVSFHGSLEGPTPWHVEGTGSISLLFFDIDVDFSHTWGNEVETTLDPISVLPLLVGEFQKPENWRAVLPDNNQLLVTLRSFEPGATDMVLHPVGSLQVSQRVVPLGITIDKVGNQKPSDANKFDVTVGTSVGIDRKSELQEPFAVGQFFAKSDNELLNAKSFEPMKSGLELSVAGEQYSAPEAVKRVVRYEKIIIDTNFQRLVVPLFAWFGSLFTLFLGGNAVSKSTLSHKHKKQLKPFEEKVVIGTPLYVVAFHEDNSAFSDEAMAFTSQVQAQDFMNEQIASDSNLANQLHVIPLAEMQKAA
jgi:hypothetical protein